MSQWRVTGRPSGVRGGSRAFTAQHRAHTIDSRAAAVARGRGGIDLALGETLLELSQGNYLMDLGVSKLVDYAYERLGLPKRTFYMLRELATGLRSRPLLRKAVAVGAVSPRKALTIMSVAVGEDEAAWTGAAMNLTIRALTEQMEAEGKGVAHSFEVETLILSMEPKQQDCLDEAISLAREVIGSLPARWMCLESIAQEWMSSCPDWIPEEEEDATGARKGHSCHGSPVRVTKAVRRQLDALAEAVTVIAGMDEEAVETNAYALDSRARRLMAARRNFDSALGPLLVEIVRSKIHQKVGYRRFEDYCRDRLGMSARGVRQRVWLERQMCALPELRTALRSGKITYSKALLLAKDVSRADILERIEDASTTTCQQVERESTEKEDRQNRAQGIRRLWGPKDAMETVAMAIAAAQRQAEEQGEDVDAGEALQAMSELFIAVWTEHLKGKSTPRSRRRVLRRTLGICANPICSNPAEHLHHIEFRSQDGSNLETNLIGLCSSCHLRGIHNGRITVVGEAGDLLIWRIGIRGDDAVEEWVTHGDDDVRRAVG